MRRKSPFPPQVPHSTCPSPPLTRHPPKPFSIFVPEWCPPKRFSDITPFSSLSPRLWGGRAFGPPLCGGIPPATPPYTMPRWRRVAGVLSVPPVAHPRPAAKPSAVTTVGAGLVPAHSHPKIGLHPISLDSEPQRSPMSRRPATVRPPSPFSPCQQLTTDHCPSTTAVDRLSDPSPLHYTGIAFPAVRNSPMATW